MADKEIRISVADPTNSEKVWSINLIHGQGVKESVNTSTSETVCFDEVITEGAEKVSYKLEIDRVIFETKDDYDALTKILKYIQHVQGTVQTREVIRYKNSKPFAIVKTFGGAILDGNEFEMKPEEKTVNSLSFICSSKDEITEDGTVAETAG